MTVKHLWNDTANTWASNVPGSVLSTLRALHLIPTLAPPGGTRWPFYGEEEKAEGRPNHGVTHSLMLVLLATSETSLQLVQGKILNFQGAVHLNQLQNRQHLRLWRHVVRSWWLVPGCVQEAQSEGSIHSHIHLTHLHIPSQYPHVAHWSIVLKLKLFTLVELTIAFSSHYFFEC